MLYFHIIYKLTFPNGKVYIGQTINFNKRMSNYKNLDKSIGRFVKNAIRKYGWNKVKQEILYTTSAEFVNELETKIIAEYKSADRRFGYNILEIGESRKGFKHSEKSKKRISKSNKGKIVSNDTKQKIGKANLGKILSAEAKEKMRKKAIGRKFSKETREKISKKLLGKERFNLHKSVNVYNKTNGEYIKTFNSVIQASVELNIPKSNISSVALNKRNSAGGYIFNYG